MSVRGRPCKTNSPDSSEPETKTRQKQEPQPRCSVAEKTNGTRKRANKQDQQKEKQQEKPCVEMRAKNADCVAEEAGNPTAGSAVQICQATTKTTKKSAKPKQEDHNSVEGKKKSPEMKKPNRIKSPERPREETVKKKGDSILKETVKKKDDVILKETLKILKIKMEERSNVAKEINDIKKHLTNHLKEKTQLFKEVQEPLNTGSYYENLKISNPDEFDVMLPLLVERVNIKPFKEDGAFYKVALKRENNPLKTLEKDGFLPASKILAEFRKEVKELLKNVEEWKMARAKPGCPAVTLTKTVGSIPVSLDLVLCLQVKSSWPPFTQEGFKIERWLGAKTKQEHKRKPFYLVPKYEGKGSVEHDGVASKDAWRISFSHIEKEILKNHGSAKTCCERGGENCCRKDCLKLLKHLLHLLKESDSSPKDVDSSPKDVCSYHAKTTLLHACCARNKDDDWKASELLGCFKQLLLDFQGHLEAGKLQNFFVPGQNLLFGIKKQTLNNLAKQIEEQLLNGFPIFAEGL